MARKVESTCQTRKAQYESEISARYAMRHLSARLRAYKCPFCKKWHITNPDKTG